MAESLILGGIVCISYNPRPSLLDNLLNHKVETITVDRPLGPAKGDWKAYWRELFAERKARRQERKAERMARKAAKKEEQTAQAVPPELKETTPETQTIPSTLFALSASPNPFRHELTVSFVLPSAQRIQLDLLDGSGRRLFRWQQDGQAGPQKTILKRDFSGLTPGLYVLRMVDEHGKVESVQLVR